MAAMRLTTQQELLSQGVHDHLTYSAAKLNELTLSNWEWHSTGM